MAINLVITDARNSVTKRAVPKKARSGLYTTTQIPGGDFESGCAIACSLVDTWDYFPALGSKYEVYDTDWDPNNPVWMGVLVDVDIKVKKRRIIGYGLTARGYYYSLEWLNFTTRQVYGPSESPTNTITDEKHVITDITDAVKHAIAELDQYITIDNAFVPTTGINVRTDSQAFAGNNAESVLNWATGITSFLSNPFVWQVYAINGLPKIVFEAAETQAYYFDDGLSEWDVKNSLEDIINSCTVEWGNNQRWTAPYDDGGLVSGPLKYVPTGGVNLLKNKYVNVGEEYLNIDDVKALAAGYLERFNKIIAQGTVTVDKPLRYVGNNTRKTALPAIRSGKVINLAQPDNYPYEQVEHYITSTRWEEDGCTTQLNVGSLGGIYRDLRRLIMLPNSHMTWSNTYGGINSPSRDIYKIKALGTIMPWDPNNGLPIVRPIFPLGIQSDADHSYSGTETDVGGTVIPEVVPKRYFNFNQQIKMADDSVIVVGDNVAGLFSENFLMKGWYIASLKPAATNVSATVRIRKNGTAIPGAVATLSTDTQNTGTITPFQVAKGDFITFDVVTNDASTFLVVTPYGQQDYPEYPHYGAPTP
jgi:hypothetical protein